MILHLHRYDLKVLYKPEKDLLIAHTLSREYLKEHENQPYDELLNVIVISSLPEKLRQFQIATQQYATLYWMTVHHL